MVVSQYSQLIQHSQFKNFYTLMNKLKSLSKYTLVELIVWVVITFDLPMNMRHKCLCPFPLAFHHQKPSWLYNAERCPWTAAGPRFKGVFWSTLRLSNNRDETHVYAR